MDRPESFPSDEPDRLEPTLTAVALHITPLQVQVLTALWADVAVSAEKLAPIVTNVSVAVCRLRERLTPLGVKIEMRQGVGYVLTPESRDAIRNKLQKYSIGTARFEP